MTHGEVLVNNFSLKVLTKDGNRRTSRILSSSPMVRSPVKNEESEMIELSRIQQENEAILRSYISMNWVTLKFNNKDIEADYIGYFESKRHFSVMIAYAALGTLSQLVLAVDGYNLSSYSLPQFFLIELVSLVSILGYLNRMAVYFQSKSKAVHPENYFKNEARSLKRDKVTEKVMSYDSYTVAAGILVTALSMNHSQNLGTMFVLVYTPMLLCRVSYLIAIFVQSSVFLVLLVRGWDWENLLLEFLSLLVCMGAFIFVLRTGELDLRRDYRLTRRLAAESVDVRVDATTRTWFETGRSKVSPTPASRARSSDIVTEIKREELILGDSLGSGSFGEVLAGKWRGTDVAIKKIHGIPVQRAVVEFGIESAIMASLRHPNIVMYIGMCLSPVMMVMELMPRGSVYKIIHVQKSKLDWSLKLRVLYDAARGMNFLHVLEQPVLHNDLKSLNLLVDNDWRCKVCDFGFSKIREAVKHHNAFSGSSNQLIENPFEASSAENDFDERLAQEKEQELLPATQDGNDLTGKEASPEENQDVPGESKPDAAEDGDVGENFTDMASGEEEEGENEERVERHGGIATIGWASPESIKQEQLTEKNDVYAFGVVIFELITQSLPYESITKEAIPLMVLDGKRPTDFLDYESIISIISSGERKAAISLLAQLMKRCWDPNPEKRPPFTEILNELERIIEVYFGKASNWQEEIVFPRIHSGESSGPLEHLYDNTGFAINPEDLQMGPKIGSGAYGEVFEAIYHGTHVAVKQFHNSGLPTEVLKEFNKECRLMLNMRHPNIVLFMGSWTKPPKLVIVTELLTRGSLYHTYNKIPKPENQKEHFKLVLKITEGMALGLNYLHTNHPAIIHRDMKSPNVLLDDNWNAKIADFGLSRIKEEGKIMTSVGSPLWAAPEVLRGEESGFPSDVYSFGVVVWEIIEWQEPYPRMSPSTIMRQVAFNNMRPKINPTLPVALKKLLQQCWLDNPKKRPTFESIIQQLSSVSQERFFSEREKFNKPNDSSV